MLFDDWGKGHEGEDLGGDGKKQWFLRSLFDMDVWRLQLPMPCAKIVEGLQSLFVILYMPFSSGELARTMPNGQADVARARLQDATAALKVFADNLTMEEWPTDARAVFQDISPVMRAPPPVNKRAYEEQIESHRIAMLRVMERYKRRRTDACSPFDVAPQ
ncbi:hypothetical protein FA95DRAFT_1566839 [Auriscalpium vulgare]|uniref:Uncharacterized protein n=1 Tax=Auriscalpium vulgare TaxID=40419 RepID=A0ACB8R6Y3_9AGAM|nr:hypothetical protein FA95DRAFT_1566839 [Auriscalpium vulgare]